MYDIILSLCTIPDVWMGIKFLICGTLVLLTFRFFGRQGLYIYIGTAVIGANMGVLHTVSFTLYPYPMAVGTVIFTSLFLASDLINEYYGKQAAFKGVGLGFLAYFLITVFSFLIQGYGAKTPTTAALHHLFSPAPVLFIASGTAYFIGQYTDVMVYHFLKRWSGSSFLWVRVIIGSVMGSLIDNTIFSLLAWYILSPAPKSLITIFWTYILGASVLRCVLSLGQVGFMYGARWLAPKPSVLRVV